MKKFLIALVAMVCSIAPVAAQNIEEIPDNSVYTADCEIVAGEQATLSFIMRNDIAEVQTLGVWFTLPAGIDVAQNAKGRWIMNGNMERFDGHILSNNKVEDTFRVGILQSGYPFIGTMGEVFTATIECSADVAPGVYEVKLEEIELSGDSRKYDKGIISGHGTYVGKITVVAPTGISNTVVNSDDDDIEIYSINGVRLGALQPGLNILKNKKTSESKTVSVK